MTPYGISANLIHIPAYLRSGTAEHCLVEWACGVATHRGTLLDPSRRNDAWVLSVAGRCEGCFQPEIRKAKRNASRLVQQSVRSGEMVKGSCEVCGATERIHGHHDDYNKPLSVRWLCPKHHREWHLRNQAIPPVMAEVA